jgi:TonB-dependent starch-binding outer membrane protein SusC
MGIKVFLKTCHKHSCKKMLLVFMMLLSVSITYAQERIINGSVTDANGAALPGVSVILKGTTSGVVTNIDGNFSIKVPGNDAVLKFSYIGYNSSEVVVGEQTTVITTLQEDVTEMEQVVVIGYGVQKKSDLTGAIASVSSEQLLKTPSSGTVQALQGKAAGVQVISNSGMPGAGIQVRVRGVNTITKKSQYEDVPGPIYIIDGIPGDINSINPNDIEHIEVLKDASAQAIYGSSGGNGVILVSTKQGTKNQKVKIDLSMYRGVQSNEIGLKMADTRQFLQIYNSLDGTSATRIKANPDTLPNTNWWNEISHEAVMEEYNLTVTSGTQNSTSLLSLGYLNQDGIVKKTDYQRYNIRVNTTYNLSNRIKIGENINLSVTRHRGENDNSSYNDAVGAIGQSPISYIRDTSSELSPDLKATRNIGWAGWGQPMFSTGTGNPSANIYYIDKKSGTYRTAGNIFANIEILKGLTYNNNFGFNLNFDEKDEFTPYYYICTTQANQIPRVSRNLDRNFSWNWQHVLDYKTNLLEDHNIDIMAGFESNASYYKTLGGQADSLIKGGATPEYQYIDATLRAKGSDYYKASGGMSQDAGYAYFGRFNYEYKNLFLFQFSYRYDGSTKFGPSHRYGSFPAFSTGFKFSELDVVKNNLSFLSFGKVRFGWGKTGNQNIPGSKFNSLVDLQAKYGYAFGGSQVPGGVALAPGNPELHWESITTYNYGLDLNFLDNKLSVTADYFDKNTDGMLQNIALPLVAGRFGFDNAADGKYTEHIGSLSNKGLELQLGYKDQIGDLKYSFDFNFTKIISKLYDLIDTVTLPDWDTNPKSIILNGEAPGVFWGYKTNGLFRPSDADSVPVSPGSVRKNYVVINQPYKLTSNGTKIYFQSGVQPGDLKFVDLNGDTVFSAKDKKVIGNPNPKFTFGFTINLEYKGFDLNCFFQGSYGNDIYNAFKQSLYNPNGQGNWTTDALNAYRTPIYKNGVMIDPGNTTSNQFRLAGTQNYLSSDWYIEDGSYLRLKSMQIGYTLPVTFSKKYGVERFRIYVGGRNLITWTKYTGLDPEIGGGDPTQFGIDYGVYPQSKMYNVGVNMSF